MLPDDRRFSHCAAKRQVDCNRHAQTLFVAERPAHEEFRHPRDSPCDVPPPATAVAERVLHGFYQLRTASRATKV
ncbi:hypothetical protein CBOM_04279 [Ceraceosorus bombacis]|uniref:Uncharacterized protein n=1 Tax=Ceraceosorus bombacis TaxID=401625 RepID=A0A0P1BQ96_9BASI|nr:hypothetical protein CBOM_04279 [Ceraceosorus bombacis]